jgi:hypothetical protein
MLQIQPKQGVVRCTKTAALNVINLLKQLLFVTDLVKLFAIKYSQAGQFRSVSKVSISSLTVYINYSTLKWNKIMVEELTQATILSIQVMNSERPSDITFAVAHSGTSRKPDVASTGAIGVTRYKVTGTSSSWMKILLSTDVSIIKYNF